MDGKKFQEEAINRYSDVLNDKYHQPVTDKESIKVVWFCYILGGMKCLVMDTAPNGLYAEVTYNNKTGELYFDMYKKDLNVVFSL